MLHAQQTAATSLGNVQQNILYNIKAPFSRLLHNLMKDKKKPTDKWKEERKQTVHKNKSECKNEKWSEICQKICKHGLGMLDNDDEQMNSSSCL